jgi:hypothetical protein
MKKTLFTFSIFFFLFCGVASADTIQLKSFTELLDALNKGGKVNVVIHYADCKLKIDSVEKKSPDEIAGMPMMPFEYYGAGVINKKAFISSSSTVMIYLAGFNGFVDNYMKVRAYDDNSVEITVKFVAAKTFETQMDEMFTGEINDETNGKGVFFFIEK